jgi:hypothetical protein
MHTISDFEIVGRTSSVFLDPIYICFPKDQNAERKRAPLIFIWDSAVLLIVGSGWQYSKKT